MNLNTIFIQQEKQQGDMDWKSKAGFFVSFLSFFRSNRKKTSLQSNRQSKNRMCEELSWDRERELESLKIDNNMIKILVERYNIKIWKQS